MQVTLRATRQTTHGTSRSVRAMSACLVGENPTCSVPALYQWDATVHAATRLQPTHDMSTRLRGHAWYRVHPAAPHPYPILTPPPFSSRGQRIVSFSGKPLLARHRMVNAALKEELVEDIHALSMSTKTPAQWGKAGGDAVQPSPACAGGFSR